MTIDPATLQPQRVHGTLCGQPVSENSVSHPCTRAQGHEQGSDPEPHYAVESGISRRAWQAWAARHLPEPAPATEHEHDWRLSQDRLTVTCTGCPERHAVAIEEPEPTPAQSTAQAFSASMGAQAQATMRQQQDSTHTGGPQIAAEPSVPPEVAEEPEQETTPAPAPVQARDEVLDEIVPDGDYTVEDHQVEAREYLHYLRHHAAGAVNTSVPLSVRVGSLERLRQEFVALDKLLQAHPGTTPWLPDPDPEGEGSAP